LTFKQKGRHAKHGGPFYLVVWPIAALALYAYSAKAAFIFFMAATSI
jgi:hypothetical protein